MAEITGNVGILQHSNTSPSAVVTGRGCDRARLWEGAVVSGRVCERARLWQGAVVTGRGCDMVRLWQGAVLTGPIGPDGLSFRSAQAATLLEFMYHSRIVLSVGGSVWYMIRNLRCTVTFDSVLANSKTQNAFLFTVNAIFLHDYPLAVEPGSTPRPLVQKKTWRDSLPIDMLLSAVSVLVVAQSSSEIPEVLMNNPVYFRWHIF